MTISRINPTAWGIGDKLTSAQMNGVDINTTYGLDRRAGQSDTLAAVITLSGAGRIIEKYAAGADADTTYLVSGANSVIDVAAITADRAYTLSNTNAAAGDRITVLNRSTSSYVTIKRNDGTTLVVLGGISTGYGQSSWCDLVHTGSNWVLCRSAWVAARAPVAFTNDGTFVVPPGVYYLDIDGFGGGGGGGGGGGATGSFVAPVGGGGGGGSHRRMRRAAVTPGETLNVVVGPGGAGGVGKTSGSASTAGANGGDSRVYRGSPATSLHVMPGAEGGLDGYTAVGAGFTMVAPGGRPVAPYSLDPARSHATVEGADIWWCYDATPGAGGRGITRVLDNLGASNDGQANGLGSFGGVGGDSGTTSTDYYGGGGGGGGGCGPEPNSIGFPASRGGAGGNGSSAASPTAGGAGFSGSANTGHGGGGGGGGGAANSGWANGGDGGTGGSGAVYLYPVR